MLNNPQERESPRNVREFLNVVGISEVTYQSLRSLGAVSFLPRRIKGQGDFTYAQLLALKSFALLRAHGLKIKVAAEAVDVSFPAIAQLAEEGVLACDADYKVGVRLVAGRGRLSFAHLNIAEPHEDVEVGRVELDLRGICALLPPRGGAAGCREVMDVDLSCAAQSR